MRQVKARDLYARMMKTLAETGNGWMTFKDPCNRKSNQTGLPQNVVHLSNLCTEITEVTSAEETAVCNLGSINLAKHVTNGAFDSEKLAATVRIAVKFLDRVIDINFYPTSPAEASNNRWRPVGLGLMGLQDLFFQLRLPFDSPEARALSSRIQEEIYYHALSASCDLAEQFGAHAAFAETRAAAGELQFDSWGVTPADTQRWDLLRKRIQEKGLRNSLLIAVAPTATIASIAGVYECIEPQISNLFKRETLSGDFLQVNRYLVTELKELGLWTDEIRTRIKMAEGSVQPIEEIPAAAARCVPDRVGDPDAVVDRYGRRPRTVHRSEPVVEFVSGNSDHWEAVFHVYVCLEEGHQNHILSAVAAGFEDRESYCAGATVSTAQAVACSLENPESCEACQ